MCRKGVREDGRGHGRGEGRGRKVTQSAPTTDAWTKRGNKEVSRPVGTRTQRLVKGILYLQLIFKPAFQAKSATDVANVFTTCWKMFSAKIC